MFCGCAEIFRIPGCLATGDVGLAVTTDGSVATVAGRSKETFFTVVGCDGDGDTELVWLIGA